MHLAIQTRFIVAYIYRYFPQQTSAELFVRQPQLKQLYMAKYTDGQWYRVVINDVLPARKVIPVISP